MTAKKRSLTPAELTASLNSVIDRVDDLEDRQKEADIAKAAIAQYVKDNPAPKSQGGDQWLNRELVKTLGIALAVILALVELLVQLKSVGH